MICELYLNKDVQTSKGCEKNKYLRRKNREENKTKTSMHFGKLGAHLRRGRWAAERRTCCKPIRNTKPCKTKAWGHQTRNEGFPAANILSLFFFVLYYVKFLSIIFFWGWWPSPVIGKVLWTVGVLQMCSAGQLSPRDRIAHFWGGALRWQ